MDLTESTNLKEFPDISNATNLEGLVSSGCSSLVEIPCSVEYLHKLESLNMNYCTQLQVVPALFNLTSLDKVSMGGCWRLRKLPRISTNITYLTTSETMLEEFFESVRLWSCLLTLCILSVSFHIHFRQQSCSEEVAQILRLSDCIKDLHELKSLWIFGCPKLASLPQLPPSLTSLILEDCESVETLMPFPFDSQIEELYFTNCFKLGREARRVITQQSWRGCLPGSKIPSEFHHRALGNFLSIRSHVDRFKICVVVSPKKEFGQYYGGSLLCRIRINGCPIEGIVHPVYVIKSEHLIILHHMLRKENGWLEQNSEIFEFSTTAHDIEIIECGLQILT